jgi:hypothetical protein
MTTIVIEGGIIIEQGINVDIAPIISEAYITTEDNLEIIAENGDNLVT